MENIIKRLSVLAVLLSISSFVFAYFEVDGIRYEITSSSTVAVDENGPLGLGSTYSGDIVIPKAVEYRGETYNVTSIGYRAFIKSSNLTSVTIPNSVTSIGDCAFSYCSSLASVTIPNSVTSIGDEAFSYCSSLASVTIGNSVTSIGSDAFRDCSSLASVTIPNSVTSIGSSAFSGCSSLASVTIGNSVTSIGSDAFRDCSSLASVTIPNSVTSIGDEAFSECSSMTSVTIPNSVKSISNEAFRGCSSLTSVNIPNSVTTIGWNTFKGCSGLTSVTIPNSVTSIGGGAFADCSGLTSVTIPNSVKSIGDEAFFGCSNLTSVVIPNSVTTIGWNTFNGCSGLTSVAIPNSVKSIGDEAFSGCSNLTSVVIPNSVTTIGWNTFNGCSGLTSVTIPNSVTSIGSGAFSCCSGLTSVTIPNSVTSIEGRAFYGCSGLTSVTIPNSVTSIGSGAFEGCSGLTSVTIPNSVTSIGDHAFFYCSGLTSVTIPNSVTSIGKRAFNYCSGLTSVTIGSSVTSIGDYAFSDCNDLLLKMESPNPINLQHSNVFSSSFSLEVPVGSTVAYARADFWNNAERIYAFDNGINYFPILPINHIGENIVSIGNLSNDGIELSENETVEVQVLNDNLFYYSLVMKGDCEITDFFTNGTYKYKPISHYKQNIISTYHYQHKDISLYESGTLIDKVGVDNINDIECLKVSGNLNGTDILTIRKMKNLKLLDLSDAHIVNGGMSYYENYTTSENIIGEHFYDGLKKLQRIKLPQDIHSINRNAFAGCESIITMTIPHSVKNMSNEWGEPMEKTLLSLQIEDLNQWCTIKWWEYGLDNNLRARYHLFLNDEEIIDLKIPEGLKKIPSYSFFGCKWIKSVSIPSSVTDISKSAFLRCYEITSVTSLNPTPPQIIKDVFLVNYDRTTLYVPKGSKTLYWLHPYWEKFKNIVELGDEEDSSIDSTLIDESYHAIKVEFGSTSLTVILSDKPKIDMEDGNIVLKTVSNSVSLSLPCKVTWVDNAEYIPNGIADIRNNGNKPLGVFTLEGKKIATLKNNDVLNLQRGIYVINGKKIYIK